MRVLDAGWVDALGARGGPLVAAARAFLSHHRGAPVIPFPRGADGLRRLADAIDAWAEHDEEPSPDEDEGFVEGAGALRGCLLLDHFADGSHAAREGAHRIRVGAHGYFDPFRAIESALEGPDARSVLVDEVARAEDEAAGRAGVGRALRLLIALLAAARGDVSVREHFEQHVVLRDGVELDLSRVLSATDGESDSSVLRALEKLVAMLPGGTQSLALAWDEAAPVILPRLVSADFIDRLPGESGRGELAIRTLLGGSLHVALILGYEGRSRYVRQGELDRWRTSSEDALAVALENLAARSTSARFARVDTSHGPLVVARTGDGLDGARLLLPTLHGVLAPELGSPFLAAAPHRDALWACACEPAPLRAALAARVRDDAARAPHRIGDTLFSIAHRGLERAFVE